MKPKIVCVCILALMILAAVGCAPVQTRQRAPYRTQTTILHRVEFEIISEPPGAKIYVNDQYRGRTPLTLPLEGWGQYSPLAKGFMTNGALYNMGIRSIRVVKEGSFEREITFTNIDEGIAGDKEGLELPMVIYYRKDGHRAWADPVHGKWEIKGGSF